MKTVWDVSHIFQRREPFRPFAPSILLEKTGEYFEKDYPDPFMIKVYPVRPEKKAVIPAVTHVDGSGRLQTVRRAAEESRGSNLQISIYNILMISRIHAWQDN